MNPPDFQAVLTAAFTAALNEALAADAVADAAELAARTAELQAKFETDLKAAVAGRDAEIARLKSETQAKIAEALAADAVTDQQEIDRLAAEAAATITAKDEMLSAQAAEIERLKAIIANQPEPEPEPDPEPEPTGAFPNATNTGVPAGTTLTPYTGPMTITKDGTKIDGKIINGDLRVLAKNVVISKCRVQKFGWWGIDAYQENGPANITVMDCDIIGPGYAGSNDSAIAGTGTFLRNDISKVQNGITLNDGSSLVQGNYIHDLECKGSDPHYDGIQAFGGHVNTKIINNTVLARDTSCLLISDLWGNNNGIEVRGNFFGGNPGYPVYVTGDHYANDRGGTGSGTLNVVIEGNTIVKGVYDYFYIVDASPTIRNNTTLPKGMPFPASG